MSQPPRPEYGPGYTPGPPPPTSAPPTTPVNGVRPGPLDGPAGGVPVLDPRPRRLRSSWLHVAWTASAMYVLFGAYGLTYYPMFPGAHPSPNAVLWACGTGLATVLVPVLGLLWTRRAAAGFAVGWRLLVCSLGLLVPPAIPVIDVALATQC